MDSLTRIFMIQKTAKSPTNENKSKNLDGVHYECVFSECTEVFLNFKLWKLHFEKPVKNNYFFLNFQVKKREHICQYCNKNFKEKGNLKIHLRIHLKQRNFNCKHKNCEKTFITKGNLKRHNLNIHFLPEKQSKRDLTAFENTLLESFPEKQTNRDLPTFEKTLLELY